MIAVPSPHFSSRGKKYRLARNTYPSSKIAAGLDAKALPHRSQGRCGKALQNAILGLFKRGFAAECMGALRGSARGLVSAIQPGKSPFSEKSSPGDVWV